ncbi:hypothetical protein [Luteibacter yeojuensis]|uniref:Uncharacterized protein n=1 Tax=Luteibacter yeojuensis TaxID=345309 RepID=A0A7X5QS78_9GAMM|nr:hypothetical protein [Luteibacter yeojuensis]NID14384.1 hypothetical protein [Luteibacter yeojuensis]
MTERYTPERLKDLAEQYDCGAEDYHYSGQISDALHQAASDAARIAEHEADAERLDWLARHPTMSIHGSDERGSWSVIDGSNGLTFASRNEPTYRAAIDAARSRT